MSKTREIIEKLKEEAIRAFDENENGQLDITDVLVKAMKTPGVRIDRTEFLKEVLPEFCSEAKTAEAIATSPVQAGIKEAVLDKIADRLIITERKVATASSAGLAIIPGGIGMQVATTLLDTTQYYVILVRLLQKLLYLYGFPQWESIMAMTHLSLTLQPSTYLHCVWAQCMEIRKLSEDCA